MIRPAVEPWHGIRVGLELGRAYGYATCRCGWARSARGPAKVRALAVEYAEHRAACCGRPATEGRNAA